MKKLSMTKTKLNRSAAGNFILLAILLLFAVFISFPLMLTLGNSLKPLDELWIFPPKLVPKHPTFRNYSDFFTILSNSTVAASRYVFNTVFLTVVGTVGNIILSSMCAFSLAKKEFPGKKLMFQLVVLSLMFNGTVTAIPNYIVMSKLHLINTYGSLILPAVASSLGLYLMKQFMEELPDSVLESARIDGASQWKMFWTVVMPMVKPAWLTLLLLSVQSLWNTGASGFIFDEELKTLAYAVTQVAAGGTARAGAAAASSVLMLLVPISIFIFSQTSIIETMSRSGMKD